MNSLNDHAECTETDPVFNKLHDLYNSLLMHQGFGEIKIEMRILKRGQKEVILHFGKQYRFVVDFPSSDKKLKHAERR